MTLVKKMSLLLLLAFILTIVSFFIPSVQLLPFFVISYSSLALGLFFIIQNYKKSFANLSKEFSSLRVAIKEGRVKFRGEEKHVIEEFRPLICWTNEIVQLGHEPIAESLKVIEKMSMNDFTKEVKGEYAGEHALLKDAVNRTIRSLNEILEQVGSAVEQVKDGSTLVANSSQDLSQGATESAASLEEISSTMTEIGSQVNTNSNFAGQAKDLAEASLKSATHGNNEMKRMLGAMSDINSSSQQISKIIKVIDEIAFQTNLLALNAAVEAARAGKHGKGFAVVAEEVRNLASRSAQAAKETTEMIDNSTKKVDAGTKIANETATALEEIMQQITKVSSLINDIALASKEQATGVSQTVQALTQIDQVTQRNAALAEQAASVSEELSGQSIDLSQTVKRFRLKNNASSLSEVEDVLIEWSPSYMLGIHVIDEQHKRLVELINKLYKARQRGDDLKTLGSIFDELVEYTATHFKDEEALQAKGGYPDIANHKDVHKKLVAKVLDYGEQLKTGKLQASDLMRFLSDWLISHIQGTDSKYVPYVKKIV